MIVLLSPAKSLKASDTDYGLFTEPRLLTDTFKLVKNLRSYKKDGLRELMGISDNIAKENVIRYKSFRRSHNVENSRVAINMFDGDVYKGIDAENLDKAEVHFAQKHVRILSGLYGLLRPLDLMQEYRLEMGTKLPNDRGSNLYQFWGDKITKLINKDLKEDSNPLICNLASNEYFKSVMTKKIKAEILTINFKEYRGDQLQFISFNAKKARGLMTRYIIKNRIDDKESIKGFNYENYSFDQDNSTEKTWLFTK